MGIGVVQLLAVHPQLSLVGFGMRYAGGCTSGHVISGLANLQWVSLVAVMGFFAGSLLTTWFIYPLLFG